jgi:DNA-binding CsgD family transcriptional regulator
MDEIRAWRSLSPRDREIVVELLPGGCTPRELADRYGLTANAVRMIRLRAEQRIGRRFHRDYRTRPLSPLPPLQASNN